MPKVVLSKALERHRRIRSNLEVLQGHRTNAEMAKLLNIGQEAWRVRIKQNARIYPDEMFVLCDRSGVSVADFLLKDLKVVFQTA